MNRKVNDLTWMIGGEAGFGIQSASHYLALACSRAGLWVFGNGEYPSLIRGGHNSNAIRVSDQEIEIHRQTLDLLLAMNKETIDLHLAEMAKGGGIIYDAESVGEYNFPETIKLFAVPLKKLAMEAGKADITRNVVGLGATFAVLDFELERLEKILIEAFQAKGEVVVEHNLAAARAGFDFVKGNYNALEFGVCLKGKEESPRRLLLTGNEVVGMAAVKAGVKLVAEYPMTPSTTILHFMAKEAKRYNIIVKHTEDELAAMNMVVGASWAGVRAMTATSGGGFALMSEAVGMAGMIETPAVIYEVQRGGPSTGLPTRTEQSDLQFAIHSSQGEFPRVVVAPGDFEELFDLTFEAFNLADRWQLPVVILADKHMGENIKTMTPFKEEGYRIDRGFLIDDEAKIEEFKKNGYVSKDNGFLRYKFEENGVSPRVIPGMKGGTHRSSTDEHDESGDLTETEENRNPMQDKRMRKLIGCLAELKEPALVGPGTNGEYKEGPAYPVEEADVTLVTWGSPKGALLEVMQLLKKEGIKANLLPIKYFVPFHAEKVKELLSKSRVKVGVEMNYQGQMAEYIAEKTGVFMDEKILKWSGRQFTAEELYERLKIILKKHHV